MRDETRILCASEAIAKKTVQMVHILEIKYIGLTVLISVSSLPYYGQGLCNLSKICLRPLVAVTLIVSSYQV